MNADDDGLGDALTRLAEQAPLPAAPVDQILRRGRRARRVRNVTALGAAVLVVVLSTGMAVGMARDGASAPAPPPGLQLAGVVDDTQRASYRFTHIRTQNNLPATTTVGAYDPAGPTGYTRTVDSRQPGTVTETRIVDGELFLGRSVGADQDMVWFDCGPADTSVANLNIPLPASSGTATPGGAVAIDAGPDGLSEVLRSLRSAGRVTSIGRASTGSGEVERYRFKMRSPDGGAVVDGEVEVGLETRLIQKVVLWGLTTSTPTAGGQQSDSYSETYEFSDFGLVVTAERPVNAHPLDESGLSGVPGGGTGD